MVIKPFCFNCLVALGDAGLRHAEMLRNIDGADVSRALLHHQHGFQVILCRSVYTHSKLHQPFLEIIFYTNTLNQKKQVNIFFAETY